RPAIAAPPEAHGPVERERVSSAGLPGQRDRSSFPAAHPLRLARVRRCRHAGERGGDRKCGGQHLPEKVLADATAPETRPRAVPSVASVRTRTSVPQGTGNSSGPLLVGGGA